MRISFRALLWTLGWLALALAWLGPLPRLAGDSFFAHMTLHMAIVAVAAPLLSIAAAGMRYDPARRFPHLFSALPASVAELLIVWAWHTPGLHHFARNTTVGIVIEQSMFLAAGIWLWLSAFGGPAPRSKARSAAGVIGLLLTSIHMTLLGALLTLSPRLLFDHQYTGHSSTAIEDQHFGGAVMLIVGGIVYLAGGLWLTRDVLRA